MGSKIDQPQEEEPRNCWQGGGQVRGDRETIGVRGRDRSVHQAGPQRGSSKGGRNLDSRIQEKSLLARAQGSKYRPSQRLGTEQCVLIGHLNPGDWV